MINTAATSQCDPDVLLHHHDVKDMIPCTYFIPHENREPGEITQSFACGTTEGIGGAEWLEQTTSQFFFMKA